MVKFIEEISHFFTAYIFKQLFFSSSKQGVCEGGGGRGCVCEAGRGRGCVCEGGRGKGCVGGGGGVGGATKDRTR